MIGIRSESVNSFRIKCFELVVGHHDEVEGPDMPPLFIDWERLQAMYERREFEVLVAYDVSDSGGTVIGYLAYLKHYPLHYKNKLFATTDSFYVRPEYRNKGVFKKLLKFAEGLLEEEGVYMLQVIHKGEGDTEVISKRRIQ